jgi:wobble nucleotide-excising tRNase
MSATPFADLKALAVHLRQELENKKYILLYGYNGTGKTRLSTAFKDLGKKGAERDTLYFNAFTEDLFYWDNDLVNDRERVLKINRDSRFFAGLEELEMDNRIRPLLDRYADFDFKIDTDEWEVSFSREVQNGGKVEIVDDIKVSRGEENIFIWCFFLAIVQLVLDDDGTGPYRWVKYIYIDDPISSLDENNAIAVANHLAQMLIKSEKGPKTVVSSHHVLFFNVLCNELKNKAHRHFLQKGPTTDSFVLRDTTSKPFLHHIATLVDLNDVQKSGALYTHHFNMMRRVMEQTANFFGLDDWRDCIKTEADDPDKTLHKRMIDLMSHGDYSLYEPREMMEENKDHFRKIFRQFIASWPFNPKLFPSETK